MPPLQPVPATAVTVKEYEPAATPEIVPTVRTVVLGVLLFAPATLVCRNEGDAPAGNPLVLKVTLQVVLLLPKFTVTGLNVAEPPAMTGDGDCAATTTVVICASVNVFCACNPDWLPTAVK